ncbi:MAG: HD domain-containing protein [Planctomycetales bacterium]|nr:HD domain-containing protein [Planctomycetales bacterium]MBN8626372.1 HD domain-containing protein [Planctomycetota bacterium]
MSFAKLRQQLAEQAARLMFENQISFQKATQQAVQRVGGGYISRKALPTQREIRAEIAKLAWIHEQSDDRLLEPPAPTDRFVVYAGLLAPLEQIARFGRAGRGEDLLSHSLRTFDVAREELPYDEEFLTAALLHDVGRAIDPQNATAAALDALGETITERTHWLIEHLEAGQAFNDGTLGQRSRRRLAESEWFEDLLQLADCERRSCSLGVPTSDLEHALAYLRELDDAYGES